MPKASDNAGKNKKNTSLRLDKETLKALKILAIEQETSVQKLIEGLISDYLKQVKK
jgi:predicted HicB family RNase H-like nuclease